MRPLAAVFAAALLVPATATSLLAQRHTLTGRDVAIYNLAGTLSVTGAAGGAVEIQVTPRGRDASQLRVERGRSGGREAVFVFAPGDRVIYPELGRGSRSTVQVGRDGSFLDSGVGTAIGRRSVTIAGSGRGVEAYADVSVAVPPGRSVHLHLAVGQLEVSNVEGEIHVRTSAARSRIADIAGPVDVRTSSGGATLANIRGAVDVRASSGSVRIDDANGVQHNLAASSGRIEARRLAADRVGISASSGSVVVQGLEATRAELRTSSGSIQIQDARGERLSARASSGRVRALGVSYTELELQTSSGGVELAASAAPQALSISTSSGSVRAALPASFGGSVDVRTGSGGIHVDLPMQNVVSRRSELTGRAGNGTGELRIRTSSGSVRVTTN